MSLRVGVFICDCGERIAAALDLDRLQREAAGLPGVALARRLRYSCSPDGLAAIRAAIAEDRLDRVVVAGCTPRTLAPSLRRACQQAELPADHVDLVDIREGCAYVHEGQVALATSKALDLVRMGLARVAPRPARQPLTARVAPAALVIGGGLAGLTAAGSLAVGGVDVTVVERKGSLGGLLRDVYTLCPGRRPADTFLEPRIQAVCEHPRITVLLQSRVTAVSGTAGRYQVTVSSDGDGRSDPGNFQVGAIIVATGAQALRPWGLYGYDGRRVITQLEFEDELRRYAKPAPEGGGGGRDLPDDLVMVLCTGQRDESRPYCSGICCLQALKQALEVKEANPLASVTVLFRDLCLPPERDGEEELQRAQEVGVRFMRYLPPSLPVVAGDVIEVYDQLGGREHHLPFDRVVLATPLVPQPDAGVLAHLLGLTRDANGFHPEVRHRLRPERGVERGIYVCGAAHGPANRHEVEYQAAGAAFAALRFLRAGKLQTDVPVASVDEELCTGCGRCVPACPFGALALSTGDGVLSVSRLDPLLCKGCGSCLVACPTKAISLPIGGDAELLAQVDAALARPPDGRVRILAFGCEWSSQAAADLAGARRLSYPVETRLVPVACSARIDPLHVLWAFHQGADGVFLGGCPPGECHYGGANGSARERFDTLRDLLAASGFDPRRLCLAWISPDDPHDLVGRITGFTELVRALGPSPLRDGHTRPVV